MDTVTKDFLDHVVDQGFAAPGIYNIPICDMWEARGNWYKAFYGADTWPTFPCNEP